MHSGRRIAISSLLWSVAALTTGSDALAPRKGTVETPVGAQRGIELSDHSIVQLNTDSVLKYELTADTRHVELFRGEARFHVAEDHSRSFIVASSLGQVRALGTLFNVRARKDELAVTVLEGRVHVLSYGNGRGNAQPGNAGSSEQVLETGQHASIEPSGRIVLSAGPTPEQADQWPQYYIEFSGKRLSDVLVEFNKRYAQPIRVPDEALAAYQINGRFNVYDRKTLLSFLERFMDVRVEDAADGSKLLRLAAQPEK